MDPVGIGALAFLLWCLLSLPAGMLLGRCLRYGRNGPPPLLRIPGQRTWNPSVTTPGSHRSAGARRRPAGTRRAGVAAGLVASVSVLTMSAAAAVQSSLSPASPQAVHRVLDILTPFSSGSPPTVATAGPERSPDQPVESVASAVQTGSDGAPSPGPGPAEPGVGVWRTGAAAAQVPTMLLPTAPGAPADPLVAGPVVGGPSGLVDTSTALGASSPAKGPMATVTGDDEVVVAAPPAAREDQHEGPPRTGRSQGEEPPPDVPGAAVAAPAGPGSSAAAAAATSAGTPSNGAPAADEQATVDAAAPVDGSTPVHTGAPPTPGRPDHAGRPDEPGRPDHAGRPDEPGRPDHAGQPGVGRPGTVAPAPAATPTTTASTTTTSGTTEAEATSTTGTVTTTATEVPLTTPTGLESAAP